MSEIDAALMEKMEDYNTKVEKIDLELGKFFISFPPLSSNTSGWRSRIQSDSGTLDRGNTDMLICLLTFEQLINIAAKRNEMMLPLYEERRKIIADVKHFWLTVFRNHMGLSQIIEEEDVPVRAIFASYLSRSITFQSLVQF